MGLTAFLPPSLLSGLSDVSVSPGSGQSGYPLVWDNTLGRWVASLLQISSLTGGPLPQLRGGTGTSNGSITGTGALTFTATGANNNVTLTPGAGGYGNIAGVTIRSGVGVLSFGINSSANSSGGFWFAEGAGAGQKNTTGQQWFAQGVNSGLENLTGSFWATQGPFAGQNCIGTSFLAQGQFAGSNNVTGSQWTAQGAQAARFSTGGFFLAQGAFAGYQCSGSYWIAQGPFSGYQNYTGSNWIAQGFEGGYFEERGFTWHVGVTRAKSLVVGKFDTDCLYFGHAGPITNAATCPTPTAAVHCAASTTARASLRLDTGVAPTSPNDGDIWFDGTDIKMRIGGVTKTFQLV